MCYDVKSGTKQALKYAKHRADDPELIEQLERELEEWIKSTPMNYHVSGFAHPQLLSFTSEHPLKPKSMQWGLIPNWVKDENKAKELSKFTLNARMETIFDKPSFKESIRDRRCLIYLDAFYEHHHYQKKTYPFLISMKDDSPMCVAGIWDNWIHPHTKKNIQTVSIVTTKANTLMTKIHNNPKLSEARMPAILSKEKQEAWLQECDEEKLKQLIIPFDEHELQTYTVQPLKGKKALGNVKQVSDEFKYVELEF